MKRSPAWLQWNRAVRAACKQNNIDEDQRRLVMLEVTGKESSSQCSAEELRAVATKINGQSKPRVPFQPSSKPFVRKIWALWHALDEQGKLEADTREEKRAALVSFVNKLTHKSYAVPDQLNWLSYHEAAPVIEALKQWQAR